MVKRLRGYEIFLGILIAIAGVAVFQILVGSSHVAEEPFGVKRGEWLLVMATCGLWYATARLVKGAENTAERQLRAYVHITTSTVIKTDPGQHDTLFVISIKNFGQTPAYKLSVRVGIDIALKGTDLAQLPTAPYSLTNVTLGPGAEQTISMAVTMSPEEFAAVTAGTQVAVAHGIINYLDAFDFKRSTKFTLTHDGALTESRRQLSIVTEGNDAI